MSTTRQIHRMTYSGPLPEGTRQVLIPGGLISPQGQSRVTALTGSTLVAFTAPKIRCPEMEATA